MGLYHPTRDQLVALSQQGNLLPVWRELPADLETPVSVYLKLRGAGPSVLLESVERGEQLGRYSFLVVDPAAVLTIRDGRAFLQRGDETSELAGDGDPLQAAQHLLSSYRPVPVEGLAGFTGGLVGYLGYELVRFFERVPLASGAGLGAPDAVLLLVDTALIFDHVTHRLQVVANAHLDGDAAAAYEDAIDRIEGIVARLRQPLANPPAQAFEVDQAWSSNVGQADFEAAVRQAKGLITAGDIFQVVLSQRISRRTPVDPFSVYRALRMLNPSPYMFYLELPEGLRLVGSSPEMLVRLEGRRAETRPIAGTRRRGADPKEDAVLADELLADPKERAEHVMLVDLGRNDLGRVCRYGTVHVPEMMAVERYSHVMHIVSGVEGELRPELGAFDLLRAAFPAGTVSGAPKVRAMEIIADLEPDRRGPYAGAVGHFGYSGDMDTCITIRTIVMQAGTAHVQAGAGIVADSDPTREYQETLHKARALAEAVRLAEQGGL
jgi:anthranilate synthase component 1